MPATEINAVYISCMEVRHLRYLLAISEARTLTEAADELSVTQPALSYALKQIEDELGVRLFERSAAGIRANAVGQEVIAECRAALQRIDGITSIAGRYRQDATGCLRVGFEASGAGDLMTRARKEFAATNPGVRVEPKRFDWSEEVDALRDGRVDVAFAWLPADLSGCSHRVVHTEPRMAVLPSDHRLAHRSNLSIMDVKDEPLMVTKRAPQRWVDWWAVNPRPDGSHPRWAAVNDNAEEMLELTADGVGICFAPKSMSIYYSRPDLVWIPLSDVEPLRVALAWIDNRHPYVTDFVDIVLRLAD